MATVRRLEETLIDRIAAGEVVERPASVVKELVENALDAGASRVEIELEGSGKRLVAVSDDGEGMLPDDARLALERHATSKLRRAEDLDAIATLGFRGEALPAIASVSRFELTSAARGSTAGTRLVLDGGGVPRAEEAARGPGTSVLVRELFFATPGRRKFLKSDATELRRILDVIVQAGLANPAVAFQVRAAGRRLLGLSGGGDVDGRLAELYGSEYAEDLVAVAAEAGALRLHGRVQRPASSGHGQRRQLLFVNGRPVQDRALTQAALRGYVSTLAPGVFPHFFLFLTVPASAVDVNVHPAKREVRFREPDSLFGFVQTAVREALAGLDAAPGLRRSRGFRRLTAANGGLAAHESRGSQGVEPESRAAAGAALGAATPDQLGLFLNARIRRTAGGAQGDPGPARLWQLHDTFILAQTGTGLAIIDQHSAHERVLYEAILAAFERDRSDAQELVFPRTYHLGPAEWSAWQENRGLLESLGFRIEPFGESTVALRAVPVLGARFQPEHAFLEILGDLGGFRRGEGSQHRRLAQSLACRGAIKAGERLGPEEMDRLFRDLLATGLASADVHGRPAVVQVRLEDLVRRFERG
ncbi:MAG: DNA mismatch repair endonuclease MutL [Gemmatimonadota bacterium]